MRTSAPNSRRANFEQRRWKGASPRPVGTEFVICCNTQGVKKKNRPVKRQKESGIVHEAGVEQIQMHGPVQNLEAGVGQGHQDLYFLRQEAS